MKAGNHCCLDAEHLCIVHAASSISSACSVTHSQLRRQLEICQSLCSLRVYTRGVEPHIDVAEVLRMLNVLPVSAMCQQIALKLCCLQMCAPQQLGTCDIF